MASVIDFYSSNYKILSSPMKILSEHMNPTNYRISYFDHIINMIVNDDSSLKLKYLHNKLLMIIVVTPEKGVSHSESIILSYFNVQHVLCIKEFIVLKIMISC